MSSVTTIINDAIDPFLQDPDSALAMRCKELLADSVQQLYIQENGGIYSALIMDTVNDTSIHVKDM